MDTYTHHETGHLVRALRELSGDIDVLMQPLVSHCLLMCVLDLYPGCLTSEERRTLYARRRRLERDNPFLVKKAHPQLTMEAMQITEAREVLRQR